MNIIKTYSDVFRIRVGDRQTVKLLLDVTHPMRKIPRGDEPILILFLQHLLETALQELLLQQLLLHLVVHHKHHTKIPVAVLQRQIVLLLYSTIPYIGQ